MRKLMKSFLFISLFSSATLPTTAFGMLDDETIKKIDTVANQVCEVSWDYTGEPIYKFFERITVKFKAKTWYEINKSIENVLGTSNAKIYSYYEDGYMNANERDELYLMRKFVQEGVFRRLRPGFIDDENKGPGLKSLEFNKKYTIEKCAEDIARRMRKGQLDVDTYPAKAKEGDIAAEKLIQKYITFVEKYVWDKVKD